MWEKVRQESRGPRWFWSRLGLGGLTWSMLSWILERDIWNVTAWAEWVEFSELLAKERGSHEAKCLGNGCSYFSYSARVKVPPDVVSRGCTALSMVFVVIACRLQLSYACNRWPADAALAKWRAMPTIPSSVAAKPSSTAAAVAMRIASTARPSASTIAAIYSIVIVYS